MFTGIVQGVGSVIKIDKSNDEQFQTNWIRLPAACLADLQLGASIANNGCCLTISQIATDDVVAFDLIQETLIKTNFATLKVGDKLNIERSMKMGDEIGGHVMSGHIRRTVLITRIEKTALNQTIYFQLPTEIKDYIFTKGFVGLDGCSLTIGEVSDTEFCVHLIPETLSLTIFKLRQVGDAINLEIDSQTQTIVDTVKKILTEQSLIKSM